MPLVDRFLQAFSSSRKRRLRVFGRPPFDSLVSLVMSIGVLLCSLGARGGITADVGGVLYPQKNCSSLLTFPRPPVIPSEKQRQAAAELLLFLIFDHPLLKDVVQRPTTSDQNLRDLFHLSIGFSIPPLDAGNYGARQHDPSSFYARTEFTHSSQYVLSEPPRPPNLFKRILQGRPAIHPRLLGVVDFFRFVLEPEQYDSWESPRQMAMAKPIAEAHLTALWNVVWSALEAQKEVPHTPDILTSRPYFKVHDEDKKITMDIRLPDFKVFKRTEIMHLARLFVIVANNEGKFPRGATDLHYGNSSPVRNLVLDWLCEYLPYVIQLREEILHASQGNVAQKRAVLLEDFPIKVFLRDQILRWSRGDFTRRVRGPAPQDGAEEGLSAYLPRLQQISTNPVSFKDRIAEIGQGLAASDNNGHPPLIRSRELMQNWDRLLELTPPHPRFDRLKSWNLNRASFHSWKNDLLTHLNELIDTTQNDLTTILILRSVGSEIRERFVAVEKSLPGISETFSSAENEEVQMSSLLLEQGTQILRLREDSQRQALTSMSQIQAILRQLLQQEIMGAKNENLQAQLFQLISDLPIPATPHFDPLLIPKSTSP